MAGAESRRVFELASNDSLESYSEDFIPSRHARAHLLIQTDDELTNLEFSEVLEGNESRKAIFIAPGDDDEDSDFQSEDFVSSSDPLIMAPEDLSDPSPESSCVNMSDNWPDPLERRLSSEVKIVQLIPEVRDSIVDLTSLDPVVLVSADDMPDWKEERSEEAKKVLEGSISQHGNQDLAALPPTILQKIVPEEEDEVVKPIIHGRPTRSLSVTEDGLIQMKDYKLSFDVLGSGKLSEVRIALHTKENKKYAVKIFSKTKLKKFSMLLRSSRNPIEEAYREAEFLRRLKHRNIIEMKEFIDEPENEHIFIVLELLNRPVIETPTDNYLPEKVARRYFRDILEGVRHIHDCGIVHRDIKPENLLVSKEDVVKIADFNFCQDLVLNVDGTEAEVLSAIAGTPAYTPPECLHPDKRYVAGRPIDLWSLGVTLFAMLTGNVPFTADLLPDLFESIANDAVRFPEQISLTEAVKDLISRLLEKDPATRMTVDEIYKHHWLKDD